MGAVVLSFLALSICLVQVSCSKSNAQQNRPTENLQLNKIAYLRDSASTPAGIWIANYDGSRAAPVPINLPPNVTFDNNAITISLAVSPDGQTLFFTGVERVGNTSRLSIYSCDISGGNAREVISGVSGVSAGFRPVAF